MTQGKLLRCCMELIHLNPESMHTNAAFSQGVVARGLQSLIVVGGQNGVGPDGTLVGADLESQCVQAFKNVLTVLASVGATQAQTMKLTIQIVQGHDVRTGFTAAQQVWGNHPTAISVLVVVGLALPGALVEIDAMAAV